MPQLELGLFYLFIVVYSAGGDVVFLKEPVSQNITYGETASFFCSVRGDENGGKPYWLMNGVEVRPRTTLQQGYQTWYNGSGFVRSSMLYVNGSFYANHNLEIHCGARDIFSSIAVLNIQGLASTLNLSVLMRSEKSIRLTWSKPDTFIDAHTYTIIISNLAANSEENDTVGQDVMQYKYIPRNNDGYCSLLKFCVLSLRLDVLGEVSGCVTTSLRRGMITNDPKESIVSTKNANFTRFSCNVTCSEGSLFTWIANGQQLSSLSYLKTSTGNNFKTTCNGKGNTNALATTNVVYTEHLEMEATELSSIEIQCVSVYHCHNSSRDCISSVCLSQMSLVTIQPYGSSSYLLLNSSTEVYLKNEGQSIKPTIYNWYNFKESHILIGTTTTFGLVLLLICILSIVLSFFYLKQKKKIQRREDLVLFSGITNKYEEEAVYATCGGPMLTNEGTYDKPKSPSPQHTMQPCEAYSVLPVTS